MQLTENYSIINTNQCAASLRESPLQRTEQSNEPAEQRRTKMSLFQPANILLPKSSISFNKWCVVACDQYTSRPDYWERAEQLVGDNPSTLRLVYPEAYLSQGEGRIAAINQAMEQYLADGVFCEYPNSLIYVERTLSGGRIRRGIVGAVDLEEYDYQKGSKSKIRATEGTVLERIPPRVKIRQNAPLELPHVILLIDDPAQAIIEGVQPGKLLYETELMAGGGRLTGREIDPEETAAFLDRFQKLEQSAPDGLVLAVGDGNHSLASAKACWEAIKPSLSPEERETHPARFCLAEVENIHDPAQEFEPIHRVVFGTQPEQLLEGFLSLPQVSQAPGGQQITCLYAGKEITVSLNNVTLAVGLLQKYLDEQGAQVDYIHGEDEVRRLSSQPGNLGFLLPKPGKSELFRTVIQDGALPRKTFSMGEANEKRYYMEAKKIR